jgi:3'(2'), 5'-bisphosphate nucleotidase
MLDLRNPQPLLAQLCTIASEAGGAILEVYGRDIAVRYKDDRSPLTEADEVSHRIIAERLGALDDSVPLLSEESAPPEPATRRSWARFWLVDPLDGTKEFLKRNGEFTVNIALIDAGRAVLGVVLAPALGRIYYGALDAGAWRRDDRGLAKPIYVRLPAAEPPGVVEPEPRDRQLAEYLAALGPHEITPMGSSLKIWHLVAEGAADLYPSDRPDVRVGHCRQRKLFSKAPAGMIDLVGRPLQVQHKRRLVEPALPGVRRHSAELANAISDSWTRK